MEGFIEEDDVPNGATHGEGLFSGILVFSTISLSIPGPFTTITTKLFFSRLLVSELASYYWPPGRRLLLCPRLEKGVPRKAINKITLVQPKKKLFFFAAPASLTSLRSRARTNTASCSYT